MLHRSELHYLINFGINVAPFGIALIILLRDCMLHRSELHYLIHFWMNVAPFGITLINQISNVSCTVRN